MTYKYFYQTKDNENRTGEIKARDRAGAYTQLRKQGIRPYRVVGDDPIKWQPWAIGGAISLLAAVVVALGLIVMMGEGTRALAGRCQIEGDARYLMEKSIDAWDNIFETKLDRYLAAYAQPGDDTIPLEATERDWPVFKAELEKPLVRSSGDRDEVRQLKDILEKLREEMKAYLAGGGTVGDYLDFLEERQQRERNVRRAAIQAVRNAPEGSRHRVWLNENTRLKDMKMAPIPEGTMHIEPAADKAP